MGGHRCRDPSYHKHCSLFSIPARLLASRLGDSEAGAAETVPRLYSTHTTVSFLPSLGGFVPRGARTDGRNQVGEGSKSPCTEPPRLPAVFTAHMPVSSTRMLILCSELKAEFLLLLLCLKRRALAPLFHHCPGSHQPLCVHRTAKKTSGMRMPTHSLILLPGFNPPFALTAIFFLYSFFFRACFASYHTVVLQIKIPRR